MVHLLPLPGAPSFGGSINEVVTRAVTDARTLAEAGFPALMLENFGDAPFFPDDVPPEAIAGIAVATQAVVEAVGLPIGVNVLRNDALSALAIASATGAAFIRVNVLTGMMYTDQGPIIGRAAEVLRCRSALCPQVEIWADIMVKHATPPPGLDAQQSALDTVERGGADALVISGAGTGSMPDLRQIADIKSAVPQATRIVIGSGATSANLDLLVQHADTVIVGSSLKIDGQATNRVEPDRATAFIAAARSHGLI
jgi:membrane complex biogenesis BtpA family protein